MAKAQPTMTPVIPRINKSVRTMLTATPNTLKNIFLNKTNVIAGIFYAFMDFLLVFASVNIMPVSFVSVFHRSSVPIVMLISAFIYDRVNTTW